MAWTFARLCQMTCNDFYASKIGSAGLFHTPCVNHAQASFPNVARRNSPGSLSLER